jgi:glutamate 5-kinase
MYIYERLFEERGLRVAQALVSRRDIADRLGYLNIRNTLLSLLSLRVVPILNENDVVSIEELAGEVIGDNDTLSALVANMVEADLLVMLGEVTGLYTADPHTHPDAQLIPWVEHAEDVEAGVAESGGGLGRGGMVTKLAAARLATASGVATAIADGREPEVLARLTAGEALGTWFPPTAGQLESRQRWMLSAVSSRGAIVADQGAVQALLVRKRSLLPAGLREVRGEFQRAQVVEILDPAGQRVAVGIANYGADEVRRIMGVRSDRIGSVLGYEYGAEVVHRNNMVVL